MIATCDWQSNPIHLLLDCRKFASTVVRSRYYQRHVNNQGVKGLLEWAIQSKTKMPKCEGIAGKREVATVFICLDFPFPPLHFHNCIFEKILVHPTNWSATVWYRMITMVQHMLWTKILVSAVSHQWDKLIT